MDEHDERDTIARAPTAASAPTALWCAALVVAMVGAAYASVPLYRLFCQVTGFDGTPRIASAPSTQVLDKTIDHPLRRQRGAGAAPGASSRCSTTLQVKIGENALAFYRATNLSDRAAARHGDLQRAAGAGRGLLQQARVLLLQGADAAAGPVAWRCR